MIRTDQLLSFYPVNENRCFYPVGGKNLERMEVVSEIFHRILTPLYGDQRKALQQIKENIDRQCYLLYENDLPIGVLVYKTILSNEFSEFGIKNSIEIKSLFIDHSLQNSGRGIGSALVDKLKEEVNKLNIEVEGIHVTVNETKQESITFFRKKGFNIVHAWKGRYLSEVVEYLLYCPLKIRESHQKSQDQVYQINFNAINDQNSNSKIPELVHVIHHAHFADIHALKLLSNGTFISGSKDNSLRQWNPQGELVRDVYHIEPTLQSKRNWVTAVEIINDEYWMSAQRNGSIFLWKTNGKYVREIKVKLSKLHSHISKPFNALRVNCLAKGLDPNKPSIFVGFPTLFNEYNFIEQRTESSTSVHQNDWVYCIHPLSATKIFAVVGCTLQVFNKVSEEWSKGEVLVPEGNKIWTRNNMKINKQRPFISSLIPLKHSTNHYGLSFFGGFVKIVDIETKCIVQSWKEHRGRVWALENMGLNTFASSGEDKLIKIWDSRLNNSVHTIENHIGQVNSLMSLNDHTLVVGTCPDQAWISSEGAEIRFYDHRL